MRLRDTSGDCTDAAFRDQLHRDPRPRIRVLQVEDQLRQVLNRVDVVMRRRRNQADTRRRVPRLRDPRIHLVPGQLTALAGLGALRHLDLQFVGVDQILAGHTESP